MTRFSRQRLRVGTCFALALALSLVATLQTAQAQSSTQASLRLKWLPQAQFAGFYVAKAKGYYEDEGIDLTINPGGPNVLTENLVASGSDTFGLAGGAESVLAARDKGLPVVAIGLGTQRTDFIFVTKRDGPIETIQDFAGHRVSTWFTGANYALFAILADQGVDRDQVSIQPQQVSMTPFINGATDVATATWYNELNTLRDQLGEDALRLFSPDDYGITFPRDALVVSETTLAERPELVAGFLRATLRGWKEAFADPEQAVDIVMQVAPTLDRHHQQRMLAEMQRLMTTGPAAEHGLYWLDHDTLAKEQDLLARYEVISQPVDIDQAFVTAPLESIPLEARLP